MGIWISQGLDPKPVDLGAAPGHLRNQLPVEYTQFVTAVGVPSFEDSQGFLFWQPGDLCTAADLLKAQEKTRDERVALGSLLVFADYLQECWWYGVWMSGESQGFVSLVTGTNDPRAPIGTFADFLSAYLVDGEVLYSTD
jgi:hypothetical protein